MTKLTTNDPVADEAEPTEHAVPGNALEGAESARTEHYDVSVQTEEHGDPDRVHVTSISPRVRQ